MQGDVEPLHRGIRSVSGKWSCSLLFCLPTPRTRVSRSRAFWVCHSDVRAGVGGYGERLKHQMSWGTPRTNLGCNIASTKPAFFRQEPHTVLKAPRLAPLFGFSMQDMLAVVRHPHGSNPIVATNAATVFIARRTLVCVRALVRGGTKRVRKENSAVCASGEGGLTVHGIGHAVTQLCRTDTSASSCPERARLCVCSLRVSSDCGDHLHTRLLPTLPPPHSLSHTVNVLANKEPNIVETCNGDVVCVCGGGGMFCKKSIRRDMS